MAGENEPFGGNVVELDVSKVSKAQAEATIKDCAALTDLEYQMSRKDKAKELGIPASALDRLVRSAQPAKEEADSLGLVTPDSWPESVCGESVLDEIVSGVCRYVAMPTASAEVVALWVVHSHCFDVSHHTPRLCITAPAKGCGKSTLLDVLSMLVPRAVQTTSLTPAVLFRVIAKATPTLLLDEYDNTLCGRYANSELRAILNDGHKRGGCVLRCEGDSNELKAFPTSTPMALAGIGNLPATLADRSIIIRLQKRTSSEKVSNFREDRAEHLRKTASKVARWAADNRQRLGEHEPAMPGTIFNRVADNWRPLLSIADCAGGKWPSIAREAALTINEAEDDAATNEERLLVALQEAFNTMGADKIATKELLARLNAEDDGHWIEYAHGKPISAAQVARLLKPYSITPGSIRMGNTTAKGYALDAAMRNAFDRYIGQPPALLPSQRHNAQEA